jgi:RNA polymerase sigma-70 factor (ECF subfamily)
MNNGNDRAFEELYNRYFDKIYAFTVRRVSHHEIAEDIVSKVFMKAFANRKGFVWKVSFSAWIYRIATNAITDHYRTKKTDYEFNPEIHDKPLSGDGAPGHVDVQILGKKLEQVLEKLKERDRMVISLKFYGELNNKEIAETLSCKPEHVAVLLHRALKKCQKFTPEELREMNLPTV